MKLSYNQLEAILLAHFYIHPDRFSTFRSRVKQLQRLKFPPGVNVGRGSKMQYSAEHLLQLVSAFELINSGIPAATATEIVEGDWERFAAAFGLVATQQREHRAKDVFVLINYRALGELTQATETKFNKAIVTVEDLTSLDYTIRANGGSLARTSILLSASDITRSILGSCFTSARIQDPKNDNEFDKWLVKYSEKKQWMRAEGGWENYSDQTQND